MAQTAESQSLEIMPVAWQQNKELGACLIELYDKNLWTDVKFHCKDHDENARIHAHKIVLAGRSPVFQAMFFGPCADGKEQVELDYAEANILDLCLRYMYSDTANLEDETTASSVLKMAHYYQVSNLVQFCADYLATNLNIENACRILTLAVFYQVVPLQDACYSFIDKNANEILNSEGFLEIPEECLRYILKGDTFYSEEDKIFRKVEEWATRKLKQDDLENTSQNIKNAFGASFYHLRLPTMTLETMMECTRRKGLFSLDEYEDIIDFINKKPGTSLKTNSCVSRLPPEEALILNNEDGETVTTDKVSTAFQISVSRDLKLAYVILANIQQHLLYKKERFTVSSFRATRIHEANTNEFCSNYRNKVIKLDAHGSRNLQTLTKVHEENLSDEFDVVISGRLTIACQKDRVGADDDTKELSETENGHTDDTRDEQMVDELDDKQDDEEDSDTDDEEDSDEDDDDEEGEDGTKTEIFKQDFELLSSRMSQEIKNLKEPVTLTKVGSPYTVQLTMHYSCESNVKMRALCNDNLENLLQTVTSKYGQLQVENVEGDFAGINTLGFENISNRDNV